MKLFLLFFLIHSFLYSNSIIEEKTKAINIIYFQGTCSSGKSTLIQSIFNQWKDLEIIDEDSIIHRSYIDAVANRFPCEMDVIKEAIAQENLYHALREKDVLFRKNISEEVCAKAESALSFIQAELNKLENISWKQEVSQGVDTEILRRIQEAINQKKNILLDSWKIKPKLLNRQFPEAHVIRVLVYCPLKITYERFLKRNENALINENFTEKRYLRQLFPSFVSLYQINHQPEQAIQEVTKHELDEIFNSMFKSLKDEHSGQKPIFTIEEISQESFLKMKSEFLRPFESSEGTFYISPKEKQDVIINSTKNDIHQIIHAIKEAQAHYSPPTLRALVGITSKPVGGTKNKGFDFGICSTNLSKVLASITPPQ